jgi:putative PIN family toxin of toxin-antitoxin system
VVRIVLDTSALIAGLRSRRGASFAILSLIAERHVTPILTTALFLEYEDVMKRPAQMDGHGFGMDEIDAILAELAALAEPVDVFFQWRPQTSDPADECVIEAAFNGRADAIVTSNLKDIEHAARRFGIPTFRPAEFLMRYRS